MLKERQDYIKAKGFNLAGAGVTTSRDFNLDEYNNIRVGVRQLDDAVLNLGSYRKVKSYYGDKSFVLKAIYKHNYEMLREISDYFYEASGIYYRLCRYLAFLYRFDWYITPYIINKEITGNNKTVMNDFAKALMYLDNSEVKRICGDISLEVIKSGAYYGYILDFGNRFAIQKLPQTYCRSRYFSGTDPIVELNLQFFDSCFPKPQYKMKVLQMFPKEIQ